MKQVTAPEIEFPLAGFTGGTSGRRTNISQKILSNRDACLLLLAANGPEVRTGTLLALLRAWRPLEGQVRYWGTEDRTKGNAELHFTYLFNTNYGHTSTNFEGIPSKPWFWASPRTKESFFWRCRRGHLRISVAGFRRLSNLLAEMQHFGCTPTSLIGFKIP